jgi:hypothetical protein
VGGKFCALLKLQNRRRTAQWTARAALQMQTLAVARAPALRSLFLARVEKLTRLSIPFGFLHDSLTEW